MSEPASPSPGPGKRALFTLPLIAILAFAALGIWGLQPGRDPDAVPTSIQGQAVPDFTLPALAGTGGDGLTGAELRGRDGPVLVNVFASWCRPCRVEHPVWMRLADRRDVPIYGIAYKNAPAKARGWLERLGNPYTEVAKLPDRYSDVGIRLGIAGVPETFVVGADGTILYKHNGVVSAEILRTEILPRLQEAG